MSLAGRCRPLRFGPDGPIPTGDARSREVGPAAYDRTSEAREPRIWVPEVTRSVIPATEFRKGPTRTGGAK